MASNKKATADDSTRERPPAEQAFLGMPAKISELLAAESDRGAILILAAYLDELLGLIVRAACVSDAQADKLLAFRRPAGDFDSKILLCTALGLIHSEDTKALRAIQKIRNRAAHFDRRGRGFDVLFNSPQTADQVASLAACQNLKLRLREPAMVRHVFVVASRMVATKLYIRLFETSRPAPLLTLKQVADGIRARMAGTPLGQAVRQAEREMRDGDLTKFLGFLAAANELLRRRMNEARKARSDDQQNDAEPEVGH